LSYSLATTTTPPITTTVTKLSPSIALLEEIALEELKQKNSSLLASLIATQRLNKLLATPGKLPIEELTSSLIVQEKLSVILNASTFRDVVKLIAVSESTTDGPTTTSFKGFVPTQTLNHTQPATKGMNKGIGETVAKGTSVTDTPLEIDDVSFLDYFINPGDIDLGGKKSIFYLRNYAGACYIATIVLPLLAMPSFVQYLCDLRDKEVLDSRPLHHALYTLFQRLLSYPGISFTIDMTEIKKSLDTIITRPLYDGSTDFRDAYHTWNHFLHVLQNEALLDVDENLVLSPSQSSNFTYLRDQINSFRKKYIKNRICQLFDTTIVSSRTCNGCNTRVNSIEFYSLFILSLPPSSSSPTDKAPINLTDVIKQKLTTATKLHDKRCDVCPKGKDTQCFETISIGSLPSVIIFFFQRAEVENKVEKKVYHRVIPDEFLELKCFDSNAPTKYVLVGVSIHSGGDSGIGSHYVTLARFKEKYFYFDDIGSKRRATTLEEAFEDKIQQDYVNISRNSLLFYYSEVKNSSKMDVDDSEGL